ncbi:hypothetical protein FH972_022176 [Carpinus fangiana]|uniref:Uncharacterized protein n=1 Tax=Carpinus fangiana TaxID=176857 RepID=A0A5N6KRH1_9ROSI|nr:hypothetical protein FH972_022176 [Carpinus fangiana]
MRSAAAWSALLGAGAPTVFQPLFFALRNSPKPLESFTTYGSSSSRSAAVADVKRVSSSAMSRPAGSEVECLDCLSLRLRFFEGPLPGSAFRYCCARKSERGIVL